MEATAPVQGFSSSELDIIGSKIVRAESALRERRLTPETAESVEAANELTRQGRFKEACEAWDDIYFHATVLEGHDFHATGRAVDCEPTVEGGYSSICRIDPPVDIREGDIVQIWADITIHAEKIEKVFHSDQPYLFVQGKKRETDGKQLLAPWLSG